MSAYGECQDLRGKVLISDIGLCQKDPLDLLCHCVDLFLCHSDGSVAFLLALQQL